MAKPVSSEMSADYLSARQYFPRGLYQPPGSFRFSLDALLLASFLRPMQQSSSLLDLGCGCGPVGLGMLCRFTDLNVHAVDFFSELTQAAAQNARTLGFAKNYTVQCADISASEAFMSSAFDLVLANPPYRSAWQGKVPTNPIRKAALFETTETLQIFCAATARALKGNGRCGFIYPCERLADLIASLESFDLFVHRSLPIQTGKANTPKLCLIEAAETRCLSPFIDKPLVLYESAGDEQTLSKAALDFCHWLAPAATMQQTNTAPTEPATIVTGER